MTASYAPVRLGDEIDAVLVLGFLRVDPGIVHVDLGAVGLQLPDHVDDLGIAQVGQFSLKVRPSISTLAPFG